MSTPALISLLLPKNQRVIESFVQKHRGTTVLSPGHMITDDSQARFAAAGGRLVSLDSLLDDALHAEVQRELAARKQQLATAVIERDLNQRFAGREVAPAVLAECVEAEAAAQLPVLLSLVAALRRAAERYAIRLVVLNEDLTPMSRILVDWARLRGIPSLHLSHSLLLCEPYTVHAQLHADVTAVFGERGAHGYADIGLDPSKLRITGNPAWDDYPQLALRRQELRTALAAEHGLSADRPIVVFGTTWSANLTALGDEALYGKTLRAFLLACKKLLAAGVSLQPVVKDRVTFESGPHRLLQMAAELDLPPGYVRFAMGDAASWVAAADVVISVQSNLSVEAMLAGVPAINLLTELGLLLGPCFASDAGVLEVDEGGLAEAIRDLLLKPELRARQIEAMKQAAASHNTGADGRATERVVALMEELALPAAESSRAPEPHAPEEKRPRRWRGLRSTLEAVARRSLSWRRGADGAP